MSFSNFNFHQKIQSAIQQSGYTVPTPIQQQAIGPILDKRDLLGLAQTGTGKTAAFVLPLIQRLLDRPAGKVRGLIIAPTRELAEQILDYVEKMSVGTRLKSLAVYGGVSKHAQAVRMKAGVDIIVACPGRLLDHLNDRAVDLSAVEMLILDEADHMFDKGFLPDIRKILRAVNAKRQTLVFSATMPGEIRRLVEEILTHPVTVQVEEAKPTKSVSHSVYQVQQQEKTGLLKEILGREDVKTALVFTRTKHRAKSLALQLQKADFQAVALQGNMSQAKRQSALDGFKNGTYSILVATDIAARGIDVSEISHVINYDMPDTVETYTHRTGRTGRAACTGEAFTFVTADDSRMIRAVEQNLGRRIVKLSSSQIGRQNGNEEARQRSATPETSGNAKTSGQGRTGKAPRRGRAQSFDFGI
ncbi:MAG: DEAD/DEAH box helicase [Desulfocapsaceae bacterium]|nr:DEAD/DEAH box helicase [Desulfocapsaceae bacterium]